MITEHGDMPVQDHAAWLAEAARRFGGVAHWRFVCPRCDHVASIGDFADLGAEGHRAPIECLGRVYLERDKPVPAGMCDWAAFGLLGTLGKGRVLRMPDGAEREAFDFAPTAGNDVPTDGGPDPQERP